MKKLLGIVVLGLLSGCSINQTVLNVQTAFSDV